MKVEKDFEDFIRLLNYHKVKYLVVGAYALIFHTLPRNTGDIDFFIETSEANSIKVLRALKDFGFGDLDFKEEDFLNQDNVIQLGYSPNRIDIITGISGLTFEEAYQNKVKRKIGSEEVYFILASDFLKNKTSAERAKDIADAELLKKFLK